MEEFKQFEKQREEALGKIAAALAARGVKCDRHSEDTDRLLAWLADRHNRTRNWDSVTVRIRQESSEWHLRDRAESVKVEVPYGVLPRSTKTYPIKPDGTFNLEKVVASVIFGLEATSQKKIQRDRRACEQARYDAAQDVAVGALRNSLSAAGLALDPLDSSTLEQHFAVKRSGTQIADVTIRRLEGQPVVSVDFLFDDPENAAAVVIAVAAKSAPPAGT